MEELKDDWFETVKNVGVTAGASAPETLTMAVTSYLEGKYAAQASVLEGKAENTKFKLPDEVMK